MGAPEHFEARLGLSDATALVAGSMIGSGIFIVSADITRQLPHPGWLLGVWALAGVLTVVGALSYGRLAAAMPRAGGQYVYLAELYGPLWGFLYGWTLVLVIQTGTIAAVAVAFATFAGTLWPAISADHVALRLGPLAVSTVQAVALGVILALTALNVRGLEAGRRVQNAFTATKVLTLLGLITLGLAFGNPEARAANLRVAPLSWSTVAAGLGAAMVGALFSADAWATVTFASAEVRDPRRTIPRALAIGTAVVCLLYLATNVAYLNVLPLAALQGAPGDRVGAAAMERIVGSATGASIMAALVMASTFGCVNGLVLGGARVAWAMARDGLFVPAAAHLNTRHVPGAALWLQGLWASVLALSGRYGDLLDYVIIAELLFYLLTVGGLVVLARRTGEHPPGVGYPWLQGAYLTAVVLLVTSLLVTKPTYTWGSVSVVASGLPAYAWLRRGSAA